MSASAKSAGNFCVILKKMDVNQEKIFKDWIKFLNPAEVKFNLISASIFITAYDNLISTVIDKIKESYIDGFDENGYIINDDYKIQVKELYKKDIVIASLLWLENNNVITSEEVERVKIFKSHRNEIAHELSKILTDSDYRVRTEYIDEIKNILFKIHKWWFTEFEMSINPELGNLNIEELDFNEVLMLPMLPVNYMLKIINDEIKKRE
jgi:hypothetical protein